MPFPASPLARAALLLLPSLLIFTPGLPYPFLGLDDLHHIVNNTALRDLSWESVHYLFFEDTRDLRYLPLTYLSLAVDIRLFGLDPFWMHLENLVLHCANTLLVFGLVRVLSKDDVAGFVAALLFSVHPLQVESVAWAISRRNVLFLFFFLLSARSYVAYAKAEPGRRGFAAAALLGSVLLYVLSCLSRIAAITLPAVLVLVDYALAREARPPLWSFLRRSLVSKLAFVPALVGFFVISRSSASPNPFVQDYGFSGVEWLGIVGHNLFFYVAKTLVPIGQAVFYPLPAAGALPGYFYLFGALAALSIAATVWCWWHGYKQVFAGLAWYWVTILPMAIVLFFFSDLPLLAADRYHYQSSIGLFWAAGVGASALWRTRPAQRKVLAAAGLAVLCGLVVLASQHRYTFRNTIALYEQLLEHQPSDEFAYRLALEHAGAGRMELAFASLELAERAPHKIFYTKFLYYQLRLSELYLRKGDFAKAADHIEAGLASVPNPYEPGGAPDPLAYRVVADLRERAGDPVGAGEALARAASVPPDRGHYFLRYWIRFSPEAAGEFLQRRAAANPEDGLAWFQLATHATLTGDAENGRRYLERAKQTGQFDEPLAIPPP